MKATKEKSTLFMHLYTKPSEHLLREYFDDKTSTIKELVERMANGNESFFLPNIYHEIVGISILKLIDEDGLKTNSFLLTRQEHESESDIFDKFIDKIGKNIINPHLSYKITVNGLNFFYPILELAAGRSRKKFTSLYAFRDSRTSQDLKLYAPFRDYAFSVGLCKRYVLDLNMGFYNINIDYLRQIMIMDTFVLAKIYYLQSQILSPIFNEFEKINNYLNLQFGKCMDFITRKPGDEGEV